MRVCRSVCACGRALTEPWTRSVDAKAGHWSSQAGTRLRASVRQRQTTASSVGALIKLEVGYTTICNPSFNGESHTHL